MIRADQIPLEVRNAISSARKNGASSAEIAAAMLKAWPGAARHDFAHADGEECIILPLPQEVSDE